MPLAAKGEFALVQQKLESALDKPGQPVRRGTMAHDHHVYMLLTDAAAQQRDPAALARYAPQLEAMAERDGHRLYAAIAARAQGVAARLAGSYGAAATHLQQALDLFTSLGTGWQRGRTLTELAELAAVQGHPAEARGLYTEALAAFEALQAQPDAERTRNALAGIEQR